MCAVSTFSCVEPKKTDFCIFEQKKNFRVAKKNSPHSFCCWNLEKKNKKILREKKTREKLSGKKLRIDEKINKGRQYLAWKSLQGKWRVEQGSRKMQQQQDLRKKNLVIYI